LTNPANLRFGLGALAVFGLAGNKSFCIKMAVHH
jgi:hypothetical protein